MPHYVGSCHCGSVRFELDAVIEKVIDCNCSICSKKGILGFRVLPENFWLMSREAHLGTYQFGTRIAKHHFCTRCGIHTFARPRAAPELYSVNLRCLEDIDLASFSDRIMKFDGQHWEESVARLK